MSWVGTAVSVGSALYGGYQANKQANAAIKAGKDPLAKDKKRYAGLLGELIDNPSSFYSNPLYQSAFGQGTQAVSRGMAAEGFLGSGNMATGLQQYGMTFGYNMLKDYEGFLAELAGFRQAPPNPAGGLQAYSDARGGMQDALGQLGTIIGSKPWTLGRSSSSSGGSGAAWGSYDIGSEAGG